MTTTKDTGAGHCDKCSKIEMDSVTFQPFILCKTPSCPCHRTPQDAALPHTGEKRKIPKVPIPDRQKRFDAWCIEAVGEGGFSEQQASWLIRMLNEYLPLI